jgi:hypothetical protein
MGAKVGADVHSRQATSGDIQRALPQVNGVSGGIRPHPGDRLELIWELEAAGSNRAIPDSFQIRCRLLEAGLGASSSCRLMSVGRGSASAHVGFHQPAGLRSYCIARKCVRLRRPPSV